LDAELGRFFEEIELGEWDGDEFVLDQNELTRHWIILTSDGGSDGRLTHTPFDPTRAGGTLYQTGLSVPLLVAGPDVVAPDRDSDALVSLTDLFVLMAEISGVDLAEHVDPARPLDGQPMMSLLTTPGSAGPRSFVHADRGVSVFASGLGGVCAFGNGCEDYRYAAAADCEQRGGTFYPRGGQFDDCCAYWEAIGAPEEYAVQATRAWTVRNLDHKLILRLGATCPRSDSCELEFYRLPAPVPPVVSGVESAATRIAIPPADPADAAALDALRAELASLIESEPYCVGDCNRDRRVDASDLIGVLGDWGTSQQGNVSGLGSFHDVTQDGVVGTDDVLAVIHGWSTNCNGQTPFPDPYEDLPVYEGTWQHPWSVAAPLDCFWP